MDPRGPPNVWLTDLDIAIGLIFVYLLLALMCTAASELIAGLLDRRAKNLLTGIRNLLKEDDVQLKDPKDQQDKGLVDLFYAHPLIKALHENGTKPSYIPSRTFTLTLLDILAPADPDEVRTIDHLRKAIKEKLPEGSDIRRALLILIDEGGADIRGVQDNIEIWFNNAMDRVSGWYKQRTQWVILALAIVFTAISNADTIEIARTLSNDPALRDAFVAQAQALAKSPPPEITPPGTRGTATQLPSRTQSFPQGSPAQPVSAISTSPAENIKENIDKLQNLGIKFGWKQEPQEGWISKILGLLLTALAVSLGAPFWFDTLNKVITVRAAGKSPREILKPPEAPPKRQEEVPPK